MSIFFISSLSKTNLASSNSNSFIQNNVNSKSKSIPLTGIKGNLLNDQASTSINTIKTANLGNENSNPQITKTNPENNINNNNLSQQNLNEKMQIVDPLNSKQTLVLNKNNGNFQELYQDRGLTYRHFYNLSSGMYQYQSSNLVYKPGVLSSTNWVTQDEYPVRFMVIEKGDQTSYYTLDEFQQVMQHTDNSSLWAVGIDGFSGTTAFYMNFEDTVFGQGQYLWWPRLADGSISSPLQPLYMFYPHLSVLNSVNIWQDQLLQASSQVRNTIHATLEGNYLKLWFDYSNVPLFGATFNFEIGMKYNVVSNKFGIIASVVCNDANFEDIGWSYDISTAPQMTQIQYTPKAVLIYDTNSNKGELLPFGNDWANIDVIKNPRPYLDMVTKGNYHWSFDFSDMETNGFTKNIIKSTTETISGTKLKFLSAGMNGFGQYKAGETIYIDPTFVSTITDDERDFISIMNSGGTTVSTSSTFISVGDTSFTAERGYMSWDTGISTDIQGTANAQLQLYVDSYTTPSNGNMSLWLYDEGNGQYWTETTATANTDGAWFQTAYYNQTDFWTPYNTGTGWVNFTDSDGIGALVDAWAIQHAGLPSFYSNIPIFLTGGSGLTLFTDDQVNIRESSYGDGSYAPKLQFDYSLYIPSNPSLVASPGNLYAGKTFSVQTDHVDSDGQTDVNNAFLKLINTHNITMSATVSTGSTGTAVVSEGNSYLIGNVDWTRSSITNGWRITWDITLNWNWDVGQDYNIEIRTQDNIGNFSNWIFAAAGTYTYENNLVVKQISYSAPSFPNGIEYGKGTILANGDWLKGSAEVTVTGVLAYLNDLSVYPNPDAVDVELVINNVNQGGSFTATTLGTNGEFSIPVYSVPNVNDLNFVFNITLTNWSGIGNNNYWDQISSVSYDVTAKIDSNLPSIDITGEQENSPYLYADYGNGYQGVYGSGMSSSQPYSISGVASDSESGLQAITDNTTFGNDPSNSGTNSSWIFVYAIDANDNGNTVITYFATDKAGNAATVQYTMLEDNTAPSIDITSEQEDSPNLYAEYGTIYQGIYGSGMSSPQTFTISGTASDTVSGLASVTDDTTFGNDPSNTGTNSAWTFVYAIDANDDGDVVITYTAVDHVNNVATVQYTMFEDNISPTMNIDGIVANKLVSGSVSVSINPEDNYKVASVEIYVDNVKVKTLNSAPYTWLWDTKQETDGNHEIKILAHDSVDNVKAEVIPLAVNNSGNQDGIVNIVLAVGGGIVAIAGFIYLKAYNFRYRKIIKMYLKDNLTVDQIAEKTGKNRREIIAKLQKAKKYVD